MKAYIFSESGKIELKELPSPELSDNEYDRRAAILKPRYITPCSSDVHTVFGGSVPRRENMILGHEGLAEVIETGEEVKDFKKGELVAVSAVMPDKEGGTGHEGFPFSGGKLGRNIDGMWAESFKVPEADMNLSHIPEGISIPAALMSVDVMTTGFTAAEYAEIKNTDTVLIMGAGAIGLMALSAARSMGAKLIIAVGSEKRAECIELCESYGADMVVSYRDGRILRDNGRAAEIYAPMGRAYERIEAANSTKSPVVDRILDITGNRGVDKAIICGGGTKALMQSCDVLKYGTGIAVNAAYFEGAGSAELPLFSLGRGMAGKTFKFVYCKGGRKRLEEMLGFIKEGKMNPEALVTHKLKGFDKIPEALSMMKDKPAGLIKVMVEI